MTAAADLIHVVVFRGRKHWVAQCLEYDIATQAAELSDIPRKLELALETEMAMGRELGRQPFVSLPRAPERYWQMWERLSQMEQPLPQEEPISGSFLGGMFAVQRPSLAVV